MNHQSSPEPPAGIPERTVDLRDEIERADLILVAAVGQIDDSTEPVSLVSPEAQPARDQVRAAELTVIRILAGEQHAERLRLYFLVGKAPSAQWEPMPAGQTLLLFLRSVPGGYVRVTPTKRPIQTLPGIALPPAGASRTKAVAHELEQIVLLAETDTESHLIIAACTARTSLRDDADLRRLGATELADPVRRAAWIAIALADAKAEVLGDVESLVPDPDRPALEALWSLVVQKVSELRSPAARPQLILLLESSTVALARAAVEALRHLHDPAAASALEKALDHPDQQMRYHALMGLTELEPSAAAGPAFELFRTDEARYIQRWKQ